MQPNKEQQQAEPLTMKDFRKDDQLTALGEITCEAATKAAKKLEELTDQMGKLKTLANNIRWRLTTNAGAVKLNISPVVCSETGAKGLTIPLIHETFYDIHQAAKFLSTAASTLVETANAGKVYFVKIGQTLYFPEGALKRYRAEKAAAEVRRL